MSPRNYNLGERQVAAEKTRAKLIAAARRLLMSKQGPRDLSLERVAKCAGVTRLTVYHQFGSRTGLLEALYDDLARRGRIAENLSTAFRLADPEACLGAVLQAFVAFWSAERVVIRRLRAMAALDKTFKGAVDRDQRRLTAMHTVVQRLAAPRALPAAELRAKAEVLAMLTSFETFDALAGMSPDPKALLTILDPLVQAALAPPA